MTYQPLWIDGATVGADTARRDAVTRYEAIARRVAHLPAGFRMVDVGAQRGYFSYRMADELGADVIAIDGDESLREGVRAMEAGRLWTRVTPAYANLLPAQLPGIGNFDVGLALSVLHHVHWWPRMIEDLLDACRQVFIEIAVPGEDLAGLESRVLETSVAVEGLPGAVKVCEVPGFDGRYMRPTYMIPGRGAGSLEGGH